MNICIVGSSVKFFSGISAYTIVMANSFAERGHNVSAVLLRNLVPLFLYPGRDRVGKGDYSIDFKSGVKVYDGMDWNAPASWAGAIRFIKEQKPDLIIMHWWTSSVLHMQLLLALYKQISCKKTRLILEMHEVVDTLEEKIYPIRIYSRVGGKILLKLCDEYSAHSGEAKQAICNAYKITQDKIHVVPHGPYNFYGSSDRDAARREMNLSGFTILYFGMIRQYKGVSLLINAFNKLPPSLANNMHLIVAGEDWGDDINLNQAIDSSPYCSRIIFKPEFIPDDAVPKYFSASDLVVLPYLRTCGSGVVNIAVTQGKPIITSDLSTMKECLEGYEGASFFPVGDIDSLCSKLAEGYLSSHESVSKSHRYLGTSWDDIINQYEYILSIHPERIFNNGI